MRLRYSIASIAVATLLGACQQGDLFDPLDVHPTDAGAPLDQANGNDSGSPPVTVKATEVSFPDSLRSTSTNCSMLQAQISGRSLTLDGTQIPYADTRSGFQLDCLVVSNPVTIPAGATRVVLRMKTTHNFASDAGGTSGKPRITRGSLLLRNQDTKMPLDWQPTFQTSVSSAYDVRLELPTNVAGKTYTVEPNMSAVASNWGVNDRFLVFQWVLTDIAIETTQ